MDIDLYYYKHKPDSMHLISSVIKFSYCNKNLTLKCLRSICVYAFILSNGLLHTTYELNETLMQVNSWIERIYEYWHNYLACQIICRKKIILRVDFVSIAGPEIKVTTLEGIQCNRMKCTLCIILFNLVQCSLNLFNMAK